MIKGVPQTMNRLRQEFGIKIGSSTGYTSEIMQKLKPLAAKEGYTPDSYVTSDLVTTGRPCPSMIYLNMVNLDVFPAQAVVKVDDTTSGIVAGLYAGMTEAEMEKCDPVQLEKKIENARNILYKSGAHFVINTTNDLPGVIEEINKRMKLGLKP